MTPLRTIPGLALLAVLAVAAVLALPDWLAVFVVVALMLGGALPLERVTPAQVAAPDGPAGAVRSSPSSEALAILDLLAEGVLLLGEDQTVFAANQAAANILGRPRIAMLGVSLIRASRDHELLQVLREAAGEPRELTVGEGRIVYATAARVHEGRIRTVLTLQDLTSLRRAERARQDLVANVSHELRTPIAAAFALAETLESGVEDEAQRERFHRQLTGEIDRLARIVDRLLRLSRIESRSEEFHVEPVEVDSLLTESLQRLMPVAERRSIRLESAAPTGLVVRADRERVLEVLSNLIDNAIRHSPADGAVSLSADVEGNLVRFMVRDSGPGILPRDRLRVFERFYTGDRSRAPDGASGTGLGLAIARHIVSRLGGEIWVADGSPGATLCFTLPRAEPAATA
ncbi:MAG: ATP-binding protein [Dehalococcoidia bacterium]|nr:ATP-binding protein [Dehalococcoidia bacterium]